MSHSRNVVSRFEDFLQGVVEGMFGRVFRTRVQPVELSKKIERAMDDNLVITAGRRIAPNAYKVLVSETDFDRFHAMLRSLILQLQDRVILVARQRQYTLTTRPVVLVQADARLVKGEVRVEASLLEGAQLNSFAASQVQAIPRDDLATGPQSVAGPPPDSTSIIQPQAAPAPEGQPPAPGAMPYAALVLRTPTGPGQNYPLNRDVIHIGRHTSNDIVINDQRVSRYHAEIKFERGQFVIYDLGSLNQVTVNGAPVRQAALRNGDVLTFGNYNFDFVRR